MRTIGNVLWLLICGVWMALGWLFWAAIFAITIVGFPFARQCLKLAHFTLWPFGRTAIPSPAARRFGTVGNVLWFIFVGVWLAIGYAISGAFLCVTIIGIPFGIQAFKFIPLALTPFGKEIVKSSELRDRLSASLTSADPAMATPLPPPPTA